MTQNSKLLLSLIVLVVFVIAIIWYFNWKHKHKHKHSPTLKDDFLDYVGCMTSDELDVAIMEIKKLLIEKEINQRKRDEIEEVMDDILKISDVIGKMKLIQKLHNSLKNFFSSNELENVVQAINNELKVRSISNKPKTKPQEENTIDNTYTKKKDLLIQDNSFKDDGVIDTKKITTNSETHFDSDLVHKKNEYKGKLEDDFNGKNVYGDEEEIENLFSLVSGFLHSKNEKKKNELWSEIIDILEIDDNREYNIIEKENICCELSKCLELSKQEDKNHEDFIDVCKEIVLNYHRESINDNVNFSHNTLSNSDEWYKKSFENKKPLYPMKNKGRGR